MMLLFLVLWAAFSFSFEENVTEWIQKLKEEGITKERIEKRWKEYEDLARELKRISEERKDEYKVYKKERKIYVEKNKKKKGKEKVREKIYIFMSSSVPKEVWYEYVRQVTEMNIDAVLVLRGCIGGCKYIKPTLEFIHDVITLGGKEEKGLPVEVWIDPILFRKYKVKVVPCVAIEGKKKLSCGDWNLKWHLKELFKRKEF